MDEETSQEEVKAEEKPVEETKEESKPAATPVVLLVDLHCVGCSKKVERVLMKVRGVEAISIDMGLNQVTIKGVVNPQALCNVIEKKTKKRASILSPSPPAEGEPTPQLVTSQVSGVTTIELNVDMHCEACALQLKKKILKMRGVQTAETDLGSGKVSVTGTMDAQRLVDYVYRRTKKQARIVPQPEPEPEPKKEEEKKEEGGEKPPEEAEAKPEEKQEAENAEKKEEEKPVVEQQEEKKEGGGNESNEGENKGDHDQQLQQQQQQEVEEVKEDQMANNKVEEDQMMMMHKTMHYYNYYQPLYVIERVPAPQLFSDENPNACCIT
ncbi:hypothetical protein Scep_025167 [Stephania cephalantha]|uniref:HMA domain-containing protein n=1 Tax=Stephania cephalantha TaxID=152367 RepID=A0AAP0EQ23_9MAGN